MTRVSETEIQRERDAWPYGELGEIQARNRILQRRAILRLRFDRSTGDKESR